VRLAEHNAILLIKVFKPKTICMNEVTVKTGVQQTKEMIERVYHEWDKALSSNNVDALMGLYAPDAIIESPLIPHLLNKERGICKGHKEIIELLNVVAEHKPPARQYYRSDFLTDGKRKFMWEYPRSTPQGDQMDFVEVMELNDEGRIQYHRVYWGWYGFGVLQRDEYHR
jgi:hypothetical protein